MDGSSPRKSKLETSKRALFQSPPADHAGPSKLLSTDNVDTLKIKRVLFPMTQKKETESDDTEQTLSRESRKRKCNEELQGPRTKWAKSLSFDCTHELENSSKVTWERHSSSNILLKNETSFNQEKNELSDVHRKVCNLFCSFRCISVQLDVFDINLFGLFIFRSCFGQSQKHCEVKASV